MQRKSLFAGILALSLTGLAGAAAASDIQISPYGREARETGQFPSGTPAFQTVAPAQAAGLQFVNREASEGLQSEATEPAAQTLRQTVELAHPWQQFDQEAAYRGR